MGLEQKSTNELSAERTKLSIERTVMAANRTQMAWVRTSLYLISFGFTIYKVIEAEIAKVEHLKIMKMQSPKRIGVFLITLGTVSMLLGTIEYFQIIRRINKLSEKPYKPFNFSTFVGLLVAMLGLFLLVTIIANKEFF